MKMSSLEEHKEGLLRSKARKIARIEKGVAVGLRTENGEPRPIKEVLGHKRKRGGKANKRKQAFDRLERLCKTFCKLRAHYLNGDFCEIKIACNGLGPQVDWYHGFPQCAGNALKYDERNIFYSCKRCNMGEYAARMAKQDTYERRHKELMGEALYATLQATSGRRQILTHEAIEMGDRFANMIKNRTWES